MNKDETKMIEDMARIICKETSNEGLCEKCDFKKHEQFGFTYQCRKFDDAEALYNANCRIIGEDEIVIKKREYENKEIASFLRGRESAFCDIECMYNVPKKDIDYIKTIGKAKQEATREILQKLKDYIDNGLGGYLLIERKDIRELANALGIELE